MMAGPAARETVYLSLGSNLGDRRGNLRRAVEMIAALPGAGNIRVSSLYETEPVGLVEQPHFLNMALALETVSRPLELLERLAAIEKNLGRVRGVPGGPRMIDIDILLFGSRVSADDRLVVPHPRMSDRRFVIEPLAELQPDLAHPVTGRTMIEVLSELGDSSGRVRRLGPWPESRGPGRED